MGRRPRLHFPRALYHVVLRGNNRQEIFVDVVDRDALSNLLDEGVRRFGHRIHAFAFMTNHIHLAVEIAELPLATIVHNFASRYARYFNRRHARYGHLFERRHHAGLIDTEHQLKRLVRYIHLNPVRAGLISDPGAYAWSSHASYLARCVPSAWLSVTPVLSLFASSDLEARSRFARYVIEGLTTEDSARSIEQAETDDEDRLLADAWSRELLIARPLREPPHDLQLEEILESVCRIAGVRREDLSSSSQQRSLSRARGLAAWVVKQSPDITLGALGRLICRDASSLSRAADAVRRSAMNGGPVRDLLQRVLTELRLT